MTRNQNRNPLRHQVETFAPAALLIIAAFVVAFQFIKPAPPDRVVMATGQVEGAYQAFAERYAEHLARQGIDLVLRPTAGSVENLELLRRGEVQLAMLQGGVDDGLSEPPLRSLGSLYYEPLWLFHRRGIVVEQATDLEGLTVAVGPEGSGTRALVEQLLQANGVTEVSRWRALGSRAAVDALLAGEIDAVFLVIAAHSPLVAELLRHPDIVLTDFRRAEAYARRFRFLSPLQLPEGAVDLAANVPDRPTRLLATTANLVVHEDLHPAIIDLMLISARDVHSGGGWFEQPDEFPQAALLAFPLHKEAGRFYRHGPPLLQRFLPFWAASLIDRLKVMLLPLLVLMFPLAKLMPPVYRWRMRSRIYRWYDELERAEQRANAGEVDDAWLAAELDRLEREVAQTNVPLSFTDQLYHLREHIELVRRERLPDAPGR